MTLLVGQSAPITNAGGQTLDPGFLYYAANGYTAAQSGTATALLVYVVNAYASTLIRLKLYSSAGSLLAEGSVSAGTGWRSAPISNTSIIAGQTYYLAVEADAFLQIGCGAADYFVSNPAHTFGAGPSSITAPGGDDYFHGVPSVYADGSVITENAPTFVNGFELDWSTPGVSKTTASISCQAGDRLVVICAVEGWDPGATAVRLNASNSGAALTWTSEQTVELPSHCWARVMSATVDSTRSLTVTITESVAFGSAGVMRWGANVLQFRDSDGFGASAQNDNASGAPTVNLTTTQANSAIVVLSADWNAVDGAARTWRTNAGALTEETYFRDPARYTVYGGFHADAGAVGTYAVGLSAPGAQSYSIIALEVKGTAAASPTLTQSRYRWRNDDGSETTATWAAAENTSLSLAKNTPKRLRVQLQSTGDKPSSSYKLQFRKVGDTDWSDVN